MQRLRSPFLKYPQTFASSRSSARQWFSRICSGAILSVAVAACGSAGPEELDLSTVSIEDATDTTEDEIVGGSATSSYSAVGGIADSQDAFCTATLIAPDRILSAAHCFDDASGQLYFVGGSVLTKPTYRARIKSFKQHPGWDGEKNDIAIATLADPVPATPYPVATNLTDAVVGKRLLFVGYGVTNGWTQRGFGTKRQVSITITALRSTEIEYSERGKNTCSGDSGGPAFVKTSTGALAVAGVTSYGDAGCTQYGVDTRTDVYRSFIFAK